MMKPIHVIAAVEQLPLLTTIAAGFAAAWILGLVTQKLRLSPIVGYILAGVAIGPHTPGFTGDIAIAQQLAEIGVILLMFGVGLSFHIKDLWAVRSVAVPGAIGQSAVATVAGAAIFHWMGWPLQAGVIVGMAMAVASTVVLLRVLSDRGLLASSHGHVAIGWLIVEDILTVLALVMVPLLAVGLSPDADPAAQGLGGLATLGWALLKLAALVAIVLLAGSRVVPWMLTQVARLRSRELFTLTVLVLSITIAVGSAAFFGASVALGAFLAGIVVSQSPMSHQAAADALPMRDAFSVMFFVSVGMLVDPSFVIAEPGMVAAGLLIVLLFKPLAAMAIVAICGFPVRTALVVALGLAQIGEFSFILGQVARDNGLLPDAGMNVLVLTAVASIALNPLLFRLLDPTERAIERIPWLYRVLDARNAKRTSDVRSLPPKGGTSDAGAGTADSAGAIAGASPLAPRPLAIIVGHGPVGRLVDAMLSDAGLRIVIIEMNLAIVRQLVQSGRSAIYGDATRAEVLERAGIREASHLILSLPQKEDRIQLVLAARELNPDVEIIVRARYLAERDMLLKVGANKVVFEEGEAGIALTRHVLTTQRTPAPTIEKLLQAVRRLWNMEG
jgi:CPA2 family monovalent cation:H+ antiporter-2